MKYVLFVLMLLSFEYRLAATNEAAVENSKKFNYSNQPPYFVAVSEKQKFVWFRVAKVGTSSIRALIKNKNNVEISKYTDMDFEPELYKDYFKFAFVRNPWSRVVSCYVQKVVDKAPNWKWVYGECYDKGFEYFVDFIDRQDLVIADRHIRLQTSLIPVEHVDFIGRLENFDEDMQYVLSVIGVNQVSIPRANATKHKHYSTYYNERTKKIIEEKYSDDIKAFGYQFEYPE